MTDLLIRGATVIDGTGAPGIRASVAVDRGRIASILTNGGRPEADRILDADGLVLAPGFIDMHSHADFTLPSYPDAINSLAQGVTTEVLGNCGYSPAPLARDPALADEQRAACHGLGPDLDWSWRTFGEYLDRLDAGPAGGQRHPARRSRHAPAGDRRSRGARRDPGRARRGCARPPPRPWPTAPGG